MRQPKPSLLTNKRELKLPVHTLNIPANGLSTVSRSYMVPVEPIEQLYQTIDEIEQYEPDHAYDYDFYVSGGMTGHENYNFAMFHAITEFLRDKGFRVFNPAENYGGRADLSRSTYMRKDQSALTRCGNILILPSADTSEGATGEVNNALSIPNMGIFMFVKPDDARHKPIIIKLQR